MAAISDQDGAPSPRTCSPPSPSRSPRQDDSGPSHSHTTLRDDSDDRGAVYRQPPSPSNTSQSDDLEDFADLASSSFNLDDRRATLTNGSAHTATANGATGRAKSASINATDLPRPRSLVPQSPSSSSESWLMPQQDLAQRAISPSNLPHEILLHIFKYVVSYPPDLRSCLLVSKAWCLCGVELLWHRPTFYKLSSLFKLNHIIGRPEQTFPYATFIRRLNFSLLASELEDQLFGRMAACVRLERLTLAGCSQISDQTLSKVLENTKQLVAIDLTDVTSLTDAALGTIARNCPRLQGINLSGCKQVTSSGVAELARNCKLLRRVKLCGCEGVGDEAVAALALHCPVLLEVDCIGCPNVTDASVREIWRHSYHMRELRLAQCGELTDAAFPAPLTSTGPSGSSSLRSGPTMGLPNHGPDSAPASRDRSPVGASRSEFNEVDGLPRTSTFPGEGSLHLSQALHPPRLFDHLRILDLTNCATISDTAVEGLISNVPRIRNLILAKCTRLTDDSVYAISRLGKNLHYLHLGHVGNITDRAVTHLARSCTRLRYIDLACCPNLTDLSVFELAANLPKLRRIGLVRVTNLTDQAIYALVDRHTSLERIHLSYCENISVPAIFWLLQRLPKLTHLSLTGVPAFRRPELQVMCRAPPKDFNSHQRQAFCVYSGKGVHELRRFLQNAYSAENRANAAQFGDLSPEVQIALQAMAAEHAAHAEGHRHRHDGSRTHTHRSAAAAAVAAAQGRGHGQHRSHHHHDGHGINGSASAGASSTALPLLPSDTDPTGAGSSRHRARVSRLARASADDLRASSAHGLSTSAPAFAGSVAGSGSGSASPASHFGAPVGGPSASGGAGAGASFVRGYNEPMQVDTAYGRQSGASMMAEEYPPSYDAGNSSAERYSAERHEGQMPISDGAPSRQAHLSAETLRDQQLALGNQSPQPQQQQQQQLDPFRLQRLRDMQARWARQS